ncbi:MAG TPA: hypothetical protein VKA75_14065, partial [Reyranella sp.]|nr:hypothetical protein [Reyranella sp.]
QLVGAPLDQKLDRIGHRVLLLRLCRDAPGLLARYCACAMVPAVTTCPTCDSATVAALKHRRI